MVEQEERKPTHPKTGKYRAKGEPESPIKEGAPEEEKGGWRGGWGRGGRGSGRGGERGGRGGDRGGDRGGRGGGRGGGYQGEQRPRKKSDGSRILQYLRGPYKPKIRYCDVTLQTKLPEIPKGGRLKIPDNGWYEDKEKEIYDKIGDLNKKKMELVKAKNEKIFGKNVMNIGAVKAEHKKKNNEFWELVETKKGISAKLDSLKVLLNDLVYIYIYIYI